MHSVAILIAGALSLTASPDTLDVVSVTADRHTVAISSAPVREVTSAALRRSGARGIEEVLRSFAGVSIKDYGGIGGLKTVSIRNLGAQHTSVVYDGFSVSDAQNGQVDIGRFDIDNLGSLAVEMGGSDDIFRGARLLTSAGTLIMRSARPVFDPDGPGFRASARMRAGSFGTWNPGLLLQKRLGSRWDASVDASYLQSRGVYPFTLVNGDLVTREQRLNSDVRTVKAEVNVNGNVGASGELAFKAAFYDSERGLPGSVVYYVQNPTERLWDRNLQLNASYQTGLGKALKFKETLGYTRARNRYLDSNPAYPQPQEDHYLQNEVMSSSVLLWNVLPGLNASLAEDLSINTLDSDIPDCPYPTRLHSVSALSVKYASADRFTVVGSLVSTNVRERVKTGEAAPDRDRISASVSASAALGRGLRLRASYRDGFRVPTFNDLYYARVGNRNLVPEKAHQFNLGLTYDRLLGESGALTLTADAYYNRVQDKIIAIPTMFIWKMRNVGKVDMAGVDLSVAYVRKLLSWLTLHADASYSYQYAVDVTDQEAKNYGHQIQYTPRHCGSTVLSAEMPWVNLTYTVNAVGVRYSTVQNNDAGRLAPYADHSLALTRSFAFGKRHPWILDLGAEALNLADVNYEIVRFYPMAGRNYRMTIKITY